MSDQDKLNPEQAAKAQAQGPGQGPAVPPPQAEPEMPMLAASAAARLTRDILARVNSPHAAASAQPLRGDALWRQVTRRLGGPGHGAPLLGGYRAMQPPSASMLPPVPHGDLVWRAAHPKGAQHESGDSDWVEPSWPTGRRPVPPQQPTVPASEQTQPLAEVEAQAAFVPYVPEGMPEPLAQVPSQAQIQAQAIEAQPEEVPTQQAAASSDGPGSGQAEPPVGEQELQGGAPPVFVPPKVVRVEFVPGPAFEPPRPLAEPRISVPEPTKAMHGSMSRHLHSELNREMVPTTDLLSRMNFNYEVEVVPARPRPEPSTQPPPPPAAVIERHPTAPLVPLDIVTAGPPREITPVEMPLTTQPQAQARRGRGETEYIEEVRTPRGFLGRVFDRVASVLPEPVRRAFEGGERPVSPALPAQMPSMPPPPESPQAASVEASAAPVQMAQDGPPLASSDSGVVSAPPHVESTQANLAVSARPPAQSPQTPVAGIEPLAARTEAEVPSQPPAPEPRPPAPAAAALQPAAPRAAQDQTAQPVERAATGQDTSRITGGSLAAAPVSPQTAQVTPLSAQGPAAQVQRQSEVQPRSEVQPDAQAAAVPQAQVTSPEQSSLPGVHGAATAPLQAPQAGETVTPGSSSPSESIASVPVQTSPGEGVSRSTYEPYRPEASSRQGYTPVAAEPQPAPQRGLFSNLRTRLFGGGTAQGQGAQPLDMPLRTSRQQGGTEASGPYEAYTGEAAPYRPYSAPAQPQAQTPSQPPAYSEPRAQAEAQAQGEPTVQGPREVQAQPETTPVADLQVEAPGGAPPQEVQSEPPLSSQPVDTAVSPYSAASTPVETPVVPVPESGRATSPATQPPGEAAAPEVARQAPAGETAPQAVTPEVEATREMGVASAIAQSPQETQASYAPPVALPASQEQETFTGRGGAGPLAAGRIPPAPVSGAEPAESPAAEETSAPVQPEASVGSIEPEGPSSDGGSTRPFIAQPYVPPQEGAGTPRGLFGALRARLFGGAGSSATGPAPLDMPWVRTPRQRQVTGADEWQDYGPETGEQASTPGTSGTYSAPGAPPAQYVQPTPAYSGPSQESRAEQVYDTPAAPVESGIQAAQPGVPAASQQPTTQVEQALQAAVEQAVRDEREAQAQAAESSTYEQSAVQDQVYISPLATTPGVGQTEVVQEEQAPFEPVQSGIVEPEQEQVEQAPQATPYADTRNEAEGTEGMVARASAPEATPGYATPLDIGPEGLDVQEEALPAQIEGGVWAAMAEMADEVMRSHAPVFFVHPTGGSRTRGFLNRIFGGPERLFQAAQGISGALGTQPGSQFIAASGAASTGGAAPELVNRTRVRLTEAGPSELPGASDWFGTWAAPSQPQGGGVSRPAATSALGQAGMPGYSGQIAPPRQSLASEITRRQSAPLGGISQAGQLAAPPGAMPGLPARYSPASSLAQSAAFSAAFAQASSAISPGVYPGSGPGSSLVDDGGLGVVRPLAQMAPSLGGQYDDASDTAEAQEAEWSQALREIYGEPGLAGMPLAHPYGSFAIPQNVQAASTGSVQLSESLGGGEFTYEIPARTSSMYLPSSYSAGTAPEPEPYSPDGSIMDYSWGEYGSAGADEASPGGEAGAWANVVSSAVSGPQPSAAPALALAGEERPAPQEHGAEGGEHEAEGGSPDLDELAETIYSIIKMKLIVERERSW